MEADGPPLSKPRLEGDAWEEFLEMAPPGFRFTPTDSELVTHYLLKRAKSLPVPFPITYVPKFIRINPMELPERVCVRARMRHKFSYELHILKVVLSHDPSLMPNNAFVVGAIFDMARSLAYIKPGDNKWTYIPPIKMSSLTDAIYHLGKFYVVDGYSGMYSVDISKSFSKPRVEVVAPRTPTKANKVYIVKSHEGDLLLVQRFLEWRGNPRRWATSCFKIFKVLGLGGCSSGAGSSAAGSYGQIVERVEIHSLGDETLFLGDNYSLSVSASDYPGCQPNCIYYTDDTIGYNMPYYPYGSRDTGIYYLLDRSFAPHYRVKTKQKRVPIPPPVWIVPTLLP
ncbi:hypothetical protein RHGRI_032781 [Rhododendron griersonianum]|uniref:KIB1-4 beta-propeller domain-containing protein n=1 Tax=Rhododendron griersonianum TaxID=479676 RepID=A0AAV6IIY7_9ERIC|nr:hypothetical protein RHGRI_032781 [Rhododendron griersonianum]